MGKIDYVKGYKGNINQIPKELREIAIEKFIAQGGNIEEIDQYIIEVDVYYEIDVRNFWKK